MINHKEIRDFADKCRDETEQACSISVNYWAWSHVEGEDKIDFNIHINRVLHESYDSFEALREDISRTVLNPVKVEDAGDIEI